MSTKTVAGGLLALERADVLMVTYNPQETAEESVIARAAQMQRGILVKKALNSGHALAAAATTIRDPVENSMRFIFRQPGVGAIIICTINPLHIRHNVTAATAALASLA